MSQRNPKNAREIKKRTGRAGDTKTNSATKKSAAKAKPVRERATSVRVDTKRRAVKKKDTAGLTKQQKREIKQEEREARDREIVVANILLKQDPFYRSRRKVWWILLGCALAFTISAWVLMLAFPATSRTTASSAGIASLVVLIGAYATIIAAFVYDLIKIRPLRKNVELVTSRTSATRQQEIIDEDWRAHEHKKEDKAKAKAERALKKKQAKEAAKAHKAELKKMTPEERKEALAQDKKLKAEQKAEHKKQKQALKEEAKAKKEERKKVRLAEKMYGKNIFDPEIDEKLAAQKRAKEERKAQRKKILSLKRDKNKQGNNKQDKKGTKSAKSAKSKAAKPQAQKKAQVKKSANTAANTKGAKGTKKKSQ